MIENRLPNNPSVQIGLNFLRQRDLHSTDIWLLTLFGPIICNDNNKSTHLYGLKNVGFLSYIED
jgi:hypothetical protein